MDDQDSATSYQFKLSYICDTQFPLKSYAGPNRLFHTGKKKFFYYLFDKDDLVIHTNNLACHQKKEFILSNSKIMNDKYRFSKFLTSLFLIQDFIPSRIRQRYFERIRSLLLQQYNAISVRKKKEAIDNKKSNRKTKTFFRFSYAKSGFYIGIYEPCGSDRCNFPSTFVMNKNRKRCSHHVKEISHVEDQYRDPIEYKKYIRTYNSHEKNIVCKRLGVAYTKIITRDADGFFYKECKNLRKLVKANKSQRQRRYRFMNKEAKNEDSMFNNRSVANFCKKKLKKYENFQLHGRYKEALRITEKLKTKLDEVDKLVTTVKRYFPLLDSGGFDEV